MDLLEVYDRTKYLVLFQGEKKDFIYNRIIYIIEGRSVTKYVISHSYAKIKVDSDNFLSLEKKLVILSF